MLRRTCALHAILQLRTDLWLQAPTDQASDDDQRLISE